MKEAKSIASDLWSSGVIRPTHGAAHLPMSPSRQGRPVSSARRYTPSEQLRIGKALSMRSTVSRIAQTFVYGPKYRASLMFRFRVIITRGTRSPSVTARYG